MMKSRLISNDGLTATPQGFDLDIRLPWYRSLPLSVVEVTEVTIDGAAVEPALVTFELEGATLALGDLGKRADRWWYVLDSAILHVHRQPLAPGTSHELAVTVALQPPYIPGFRMMTRCVKTLRAH